MGSEENEGMDQTQEAMTLTREWAEHPRWCETATPDLEEARRFAEGIHAKYPGKPLAYNCSPSFNWKNHHEERL